MIKDESTQQPVLIFKHSTTCSISRLALDRLDRNLASQELKAYYLDLKTYREVSNQIEVAFDVEHESPQVLIIDNGKAVYHRSHSAIEAAGIRDFLASAGN